jgi:hypothetical protein
LNDAAIVCLDIEWWQHDPTLTTELGIAEMSTKGVIPSSHAENILMGIQVAHARLQDNSHLLNTFQGAGNPEVFSFGTSKFVTAEEAKGVLINTFVRARLDGDGSLQPIILVGHDVKNEFEHIERAFGIDIRCYGTIVKVIDTQAMALEAGIEGPKGPSIGLGDLLAYFNINIHNLHTAGNDAAATLMVAVLIVLKSYLYPTGPPRPFQQHRNIHDVVRRVMALGKTSSPPSWGRSRFCTRCDRDNHVRANCFAKVSCDICRDSGVKRLYNAHLTHSKSKCVYNHHELPDKDYGVPVTATVLPAEVDDLFIWDA